MWKKINKDIINNIGPKCNMTDFELFKYFLENNDIVEYKKDIGSGVSIRKFFETGGSTRGKKEILIKKELPPRFVDHQMFFRTKTKKVIFTSQVYNLNANEIEKIFQENFDPDFELKIYNSRESWYNPNETILFSISLKDK